MFDGIRKVALAILVHGRRGHDWGADRGFGRGLSALDRGHGRIGRRHGRRSRVRVPYRELDLRHQMDSIPSVHWSAFPCLEAR